MINLVEHKTKYFLVSAYCVLSTAYLSGKDIDPK